MSDPSANPLSRAKIRQLLTAVGSTHTRDEAVPQVLEYDWRDPHYFNEDQLNRLAAVMSQVAARIAGTFTRFYSSEFDVSPLSINQHYADDLCHCMETDHICCVVFGLERNPPCGFMAIPTETALSWVTRLLGDSETGSNPERPFSSLEESLLSDLVTAVLENFLTPLRSHHRLEADSRLCRGQPSIQFDRAETVSSIVFQVRKADETSDVTFVLPCRTLAALVGKNTSEAPGSSPQDPARALMEHLLNMPVTIMARLASSTVSFQEMMDLAPGDILLLEKPIDGLMELVVGDRVLFLGRPARSEDRYAVSITASQTAGGPAPSGAPR